MKPKTLKIQGLNSFQQQQIIDFDKLMSRGLFGIFGATGSGKSTILDAITLSLYGEIARNSKNFINSDMDSASISFEFELNNNSVNEIYTVERIYKRNKEGGCNCKSARITKKINNEIKIIEEGANAVDKKVEEIIGLNKYDFTRTVVLPQGKFSEFLTLTSKQRNDMLERILHLEEYGKIFEEKLKIIKAKAKLDLEKLNSKMSVYASISSEQLSQLVDSQNLLNENISILKQKKSKLDEAVQLQKEIFKLQEEKNFYQTKYESLIVDKENIESQKLKLDLAKKADIILPNINSLEETKQKLNFITDELNKKSKELTLIDENLKSAQKLYDDAKEIKDNQYNCLLEQEAKLNQALELLNKVSILENDKAVLGNQHKEFEKRFNNLKVQENDINTNLNKANQELDSIVAQKNELYIPGEYRQEIERGHQCQKDYDNICLHLKEVDGKIADYTKAIEKANEQLLDSSLNKINDDIIKYENDLNKLNSSDFLDADILIKLQEKGNKISLEHNEVKNYEQKKQLLEKNIIDLKQNTDKYKSNLQTEDENLKNYSDEFEDLNKQLEAYKIINQSSIIAKMLEDNTPCPVCGSLEHPTPAKEIDNKILTVLNESIDNIKAKINKTEKTINKLNSNIEVNEKEYKKLEAELSEINKNLDGRISEQLYQYLTDLRQQFKDTRDNIRRLEKEKNLLEKQIQSKKDEQNKLKLENTRILERQNKDKQIKDELNSEKQTLDKNFKLICEKLNDLKSSLDINDFEKEKNTISEKEKRYSIIVKSEADIQENIKLYEKQRYKLSEDIKEAEKNLWETNEKINQKQSSIDNYKEDIKNLAQNNNPKDYIIIIKDKINKIDSDVEKFSMQLDIVQKKYQEISKTYINYTSSKDTLNDLLTSQGQILNTKLEENNFKTIKEVKDLYIERQIQVQMEEAINKYDKDYNDTINNIERIDKNLKGETVNKNELETKISVLNDITNQLEDSSNQLAITNEKISTMKVNLKQVEQFNNDKAKLDHEIELLEQLSKLIGAKKFVQFISHRQMVYIAKEASKTLRKITRDRYSIELDDTSSFIMRDDFLGGVKRKPETLSGGELFVTSLSLALALSTQIQLKSKTPIEFFFLDEGFGSLDSKLLDTVIEALEKLNSEHIHVGIISHVEELKERISAKLIVDNAQYGISGSSVELELS